MYLAATGLPAAKGRCVREVKRVYGRRERNKQRNQNIFLSFSIEFLEFFAVTRMLRLLKLTRQSSGLKILIQTFKASFKELMFILFFMISTIIIFASLVYYAERSAVRQKKLP